jgi:hypothetical protein
MTSGLIGADPQMTWNKLPPSTARTWNPSRHIRKFTTEYGIESHLTEDQPVPERVSVDTGSVQPFQFDCHRFPEKGTAEVGEVAGKHRAMINPIQHSRNRQEKLRLQSLGIVK